MREIRFRGKSGNRWVFGFYYNECGVTHIIEDRQKDSQLNRNTCYEVDKETVGQFTGLLDKNGKEIHEGDIVKICTRYFNGLCFVGVFNAQFALFSCHGKNLVGYFRGDAPRREVIGNIHDNPELIH